MIENCSFCRFFEEKTFVDLEDELFWGMFDFNPVSPGHLLLIPKRHVVDCESLTQAEWISLQGVIKKATTHIESTDLKKIYEQIIHHAVSPNSVWFAQKALNSLETQIKPDAYNYGINDGKAAGRTIDHFHWHIIPRYNGDMEDPRGGVRHVIPEMGNYKTVRV